MTETDQTLALVKRLGLVRPKDLNQHGIPVIYLRRLLHRGELVQPARGVYAVTGHEPTLHHSLAMVSKRIPRGVVCLLSALAYHDIGTQLPSVVEEHSVEGVTVRITNPAKTVADCFKFRNKVGLDIALEALRDAWRKRKVTMVELDRFAATNRMTNVMRPYLEMLT
jgi:predicted transcriptional regulator of viral defense system